MVFNRNVNLKWCDLAVRPDSAAWQCCLTVRLSSAAQSCGLVRVAEQCGLVSVEVCRGHEVSDDRPSSTELERRYRRVSCNNTLSTHKWKTGEVSFNHNSPSINVPGCTRVVFFEKGVAVSVALGPVVQTELQPEAESSRSHAPLVPLRATQVALLPEPPQKSFLTADSPHLAESGYGCGSVSTTGPKATDAATPFQKQNPSVARDIDRRTVVAEGHFTCFPFVS